MNAGNPNDGSSGLCGNTGKRIFPTREAASAYVARYASKFGKRKAQRRCPFCDGYHVTKGERGRPGRGK